MLVMLCKRIGTFWAKCSIAIKCIAQLGVNGISKFPILRIVIFCIFQSMGDYLRGIWNKHRADIFHYLRTCLSIDSSPSVQIDANDPAILFSSNLRFPNYVFVLVTSIGTDEHHVCARQMNSRATFSFDVVFIFRVDFTLKLTVAKIEIKVFTVLPGTHQPIMADVRTAKSNKCARKTHSRPNLLRLRANSIVKAELALGESVILRDTSNQACRIERSVNSHLSFASLQFYRSGHSAHLR